MTIWKIYCILCFFITIKFGSNCQGEVYTFRRENDEDIEKSIVVGIKIQRSSVSKTDAINLLKYEFGEYFSELKFIGTKIPGRWKGHYFYQLDEDKLRNLCDMARKNVKLEDVSPAHSTYVPKLHEFQVDVKWLKSTLVIECETVPTAYLQYDKDKKEIIVLTEKNEFLKASISFYIETVKADPKECRETLKNDPKNFDMTHAKFDELVQDECQNNFTLTTSQLRTMKSSKLLNLCHAATIKRSDEYKLLEFVFKDTTVNEPELYTFTYDSGRKETRAAIKCPTLPPIFLHFINLRINENVRVILPKKGKN